MPCTCYHEIYSSIRQNVTPHQHYSIRRKKVKKRDGQLSRTWSKCRTERSMRRYDLPSKSSAGGHPEKTSGVPSVLRFLAKSDIKDIVALLVKIEEHREE